MSGLPRDAILLVVARVHGMLCRERGQTLAEYELIMAIIAVAVIVTALTAFRDVLIPPFQSAVACFDGDC